MISVVHVIGRMAPGGTEHQLIGMLQAAHGKLWNATLCVLSSGWDLSARLRRSGVPVVELDGTGRGDPRRVPRFRRQIDGANLLHSSLWGANAYARLASVGPRRPPLVISERGVEDHRSPLQRRVDRLLARRTAGFIGNSPAVTDFISRWHGVPLADPRLVEIRNGLDTDVFHNRGRQDGRHGASRIVTVGRLVPEKRIDLVISLLPQIEKTASVELTVIGDGPERDQLADMAAGLPVRFMGHVGRREQVASILRSADVLVMPSCSEGLPNAVIEALACGVRVVASDIPGIRPLMGPGVGLVENRGRWVDEILAAMRAGPLDTSVPLGSVRSFELVAKEHLAAFEEAIERAQKD